MNGLVFLGDKKLALHEFADPTPGFGEVILQIKASGMCGTAPHDNCAPHNPNLPLE